MNVVNDKKQCLQLSNFQVKWVHQTFICIIGQKSFDINLSLLFPHPDTEKNPEKIKIT